MILKVFTVFSLLLVGTHGVTIKRDDFVTLCHLIEGMINDGMPPEVAVDRAGKLFVTMILVKTSPDMDAASQPLIKAASPPLISQFHRSGAGLYADESTVAQTETITVGEYLLHATINTVAEAVDAEKLLAKLKNIFGFLSSVAVESTQNYVTDSGVNVFGKRQVLSTGIQLPCANLPFPDEIDSGNLTLIQPEVLIFLKEWMAGQDSQKQSNEDQ